MRTAVPLKLPSRNKPNHTEERRHHDPEEVNGELRPVWQYQ